MPFNPEQGDTRRESIIKRALLALPFLCIFYAALLAMDPTPLFPHAGDMIAKGVVDWDNGSAPIRFVFYHIKALDNL
jgi:hypothetical protein